MTQHWKLFELTQEPTQPGIEGIRPLYEVDRVVSALRRQGQTVERIHFLENPRAFLMESQAAELLEEEGDTAFPLVLLNGQCFKKGAYPTHAEWCEGAQLGPDLIPSVFSEAELKAYLSLMEASSCGGGGCAGCSGCGGGCGSSAEPEETDWNV